MRRNAAAQRRWTRTRLVTALAVLTATLVLGDRPASPAAEAITVHRVADASFEVTPTEPLFLLVVGTDARAGVEGERGDAIHLVGVHPGTGAATILNIPRDTWVAIPGQGHNKITMAYWHGRDRLMAEAVGRLVGVNVPIVVSTDFAGFQALVDDMGGVDIDIPFAMADKASGAYFQAGPRHLVGGEALAFARNRHLPGGDITRTEHQARLLVAALAKARAHAGGSPAASLHLLGVLARRVRLDGASWTDAYRLLRLAVAIDPSRVRSVTMPARLGWAGRASVVYPQPQAQGLFADFRDDAVLQHH